METVEQEIEKVRAALLQELIEDDTKRHIRTLDKMERILKGQPRPISYDRKREIRVGEYKKPEWIAKLKEELQEVDDATGNLERAQELSDLITVATSWQAQMGYGFDERLEIQRETNTKNESRGAFRHKE